MSTKLAGPPLKLIPFAQDLLARLSPDDPVDDRILRIFTETLVRSMVQAVREKEILILATSHFQPTSSEATAYATFLTGKKTGDGRHEPREEQEAEAEVTYNDVWLSTVDLELDRDDWFNALKPLVPTQVRALFKGSDAKLNFRAWLQEHARDKLLQKFITDAVRGVVARQTAEEDGDAFLSEVTSESITDITPPGFQAEEWASESGAFSLSEVGRLKVTAQGFSVPVTIKYAFSMDEGRGYYDNSYDYDPREEHDWDWEARADAAADRYERGMMDDSRYAKLRKNTIRLASRTTNPKLKSALLKVLGRSS